MKSFSEHCHHLNIKSWKLKNLPFLKESATFIKLQNILISNIMCHHCAKQGRGGSNKRLKNKETLFPIHVSLSSYRYHMFIAHNSLSSAFVTLTFPQLQLAASGHQLQKTWEVKMLCKTMKCASLSFASPLGSPLMWGEA